MSDGNKANITALLREAGEGNRASFDRLLPIVYEELRLKAARHLERERHGHTLQTTALVHEAYLRLVDGDANWNDRRHFYAVASTCMRRILVDYARRRQALKRDGVRSMMDLDQVPVVGGDSGEELLALEGALQRFAEQDPRRAQVVELKLFCGLENARIAEALEVSAPTVERDWRLARAWLHRELKAMDS